MVVRRTPRKSKPVNRFTFEVLGGGEARDGDNVEEIEESQRDRTKRSTLKTNISSSSSSSSLQSKEEGFSMKAIGQLLLCISGIYFFYILYGVLQEDIYHRQDDGTKFESTYFVLFIQCIANSLVAWFGWICTTKIFTSNKKDKQVKSVWKSAKSAPGYLKTLFGSKMTGNTWMGVISFSYVFAMACSNMALQYVNYPTQALGKSCKMIPIMAFNVMVNKTPYTKLEYGAVLLITVGIVIFRVFKASNKEIGENSTVGLLLLLGSLCLDGVTSSNQKPYRKEFSENSIAGALKMMLHTNVWAVLHLGVVALATNDLFTGAAYCADHPELYAPIVKFGLCSALGQIFIFLTITGPGPLACSTITTTRKFFTILISVLMRPENSLTNEQWTGVGLVFSGLGMKLMHEMNEKKKKKRR